MVVRFSSSAKLILAPSVQQRQQPSSVTLPEGGQWRGTRARPPLNHCFSKCSTKAKTKSRLSYAYMALGDYDFIAAHAERERPAVGEPGFFLGDGSYSRIGRAVYPGFLARAVRIAAGERCPATDCTIGEYRSRLAPVCHHGPGSGPRDRAGARSDGNAEDPYPVG